MTRRSIGLKFAPLLTCALAPLSWAQPTSTVAVTITPRIEGLQPVIQLRPDGSDEDVWPSPHALVGPGIPHGWYELKVSAPGFKVLRRRLVVIGDRVEVRAVLVIAGEAVGAARLRGTVKTQDYGGLWVIAFPLSGDPAETIESQVDSSGHFEIATVNIGPYVLALVKGTDVLYTQQATIGFKNPDLSIDLGR